MSIISTASSSRTPRRAATCSNGYRLTQTRSNGSISCSSSAAESSARSRRARIAAWMRGWSVFTRPPSSSGPRSAPRPRTSSPSSSRYAAVPPLATSSTAELGEAARELVEARLVVDRDQRAHIALARRVGSSRCSTAWMRRAASRPCRRPRRERAPGRSRARCRCPRRRSGPSRPSRARPPRARPRSARGPGNCGRRAGWTLTTRPGKRSRNGGRSSCM